MPFHNGDLIADMFATAESGARVEIDGTQAGKVIRFYSGLAGETFPASIWLDPTNGDLTIEAAHFGFAGGQSLTLHTDAGGADGRVECFEHVEAGGDVVKAPFFSSAGDVAPMLSGYDGKLAGSFFPTLDGSYRIQMQCGESFNNVNAGGVLHVGFPHAFPNGLLTVVASNGEAALGVESVATTNHTSAGFDAVYTPTPAGTPIRHCHWIALGF